MIQQPSIDVTIAHIQPPNNPCGGYTVYMVERDDGKYKVTLCQCNSKQHYNMERGAAIARKRSEEGKFFVMSKDEVVVLVSQLQEKFSA